MISQSPPLIIASLINIYDFKFVTTIEKVSIAFLILSLIAFPIALLYSFYILKKYKNDLESDIFKEKYSVLIEGINTKTKIGLYWNPLVLLRWAITNVILVTLKDSFLIQIFTLMIISVIFQALIIKGQPLETRGENLQGLFLEVCNSIYLYILLMLTDFTGRNPFRE